MGGPPHRTATRTADLEPGGSHLRSLLPVSPVLAQRPGPLTPLTALRGPGKPALGFGVQGNVSKKGSMNVPKPFVVTTEVNTAFNHPERMITRETKESAQVP